MDKQITITAETKNGKLGFYNIGYLNDFAKQNPNSKFVVTFMLNDGESKDKMIRYFYAKVLPDWQKALFEKGIIMNKKEVERHIMDLTPITQDKLSISELGVYELSIWFDSLANTSLSEHQLFIEDYRNL
jgi:hypothetical protein